MYKIAVLGEPWAVWGFAGLGLSVYPVDKKEKARDKLRSIQKDHAIIFVTEIFRELVEDRLKLEHKDRFPIICLIPNHIEKKNFGRQVIREVVRKAVGFEI